MESQQTFWSRHFLSTDIMSRIAWNFCEVVIILLINPITYLIFVTNPTNMFV